MNTTIVIVDQETRTNILRMRQAVELIGLDVLGKAVDKYGLDKAIKIFMNAGAPEPIAEYLAGVLSIGFLVIADMDIQ